MAATIQWNRMSNRQKIFIIIALFATLIIAIIIGSAIINNQNKEDLRTTPQQAANTTITESVAEKSCQDMATLKTQGQDINVIDVWNYKPQFSEFGGIYTLSWNGSKDGKVVTFVCELSGTDNNAQIKSLDMDAQRLQ